MTNAMSAVARAVKGEPPEKKQFRFGTSIIARYHGGQCCGMSQIYSFPYEPAQVLKEQVPGTPEEWKNHLKECPWHYGSIVADLPEQTAGERLAAQVKVIVEGHRMKWEPGEYAKWGKLTTEERYRQPCIGGRPKGIIEIVLKAGQLSLWRKTVESLGFKEVNSHKNSNTGNTIHVFHLNTGE